MRSGSRHQPTLDLRQVPIREASLATVVQSAWRLQLPTSELSVTSIREAGSEAVSLLLVEDWGHTRRKMELSLNLDQIVELAKFLADVVVEDEEPTDPGRPSKMRPPNGGDP